MRLSRYYAPTLKEDPAEAEVVSHRLMLRAGMIRKVTSGIYNFLPYGWRAVMKVAQVVREEMDRAGALEILMPMVQPGDLWKETGRWDVYGKELLRLTDRHGRDYCLGPTHEEVVTDLLRGELRSYRQLPVNLYQIQGKFRDEIRPRFGLMRGREFIMKDAYSFDADDAGADKSYEAMYQAYTNIFSRLGLKFRAVEADSGPIGGSFSHEFMVLADTGEDTIAVCAECRFAANLEKAECVCGSDKCDKTCAAHEVVQTPGMHTVEEVAGFLKVLPQRLVKTLLYDADGEIVAALVRGDRDLNEVKLKNYLGAMNLEMASPEQVQKASGAPVGFAGPVGLNVKTVVADAELAGDTDYVVGANRADAHMIHVDLDRDADIAKYLDLREIAANDACPRCGKHISLTKGIEVGHVFKLGTKYSESLNLKFLDEDGKERLVIMGCYGIGVTRVLAACIEQNHDENGMILPPPIAPYLVAIMPLSMKSPEVAGKAEEIYRALTAKGLDVLLDDRDERPGVKFKDMDLLGAPIHLVIGDKGLGRGAIEAKDRRTGDKKDLSLENLDSDLTAFVREVWQGWDIPDQPPL